ncbi:MAG TPA: MlaD family protein [Candidatus Bathyarchaeia archaeon]|nr:MlaD family protein [Candidatus Bathyarchaeia archaeon]
MQHKDQVQKIVAGVFLLFCVTLIVVMTFTIGLEKGFTEPKVKMTVLFRKVGGLAMGAPVRLSGVTVGTVADINFLKEEVHGRGVTVSLSLYKKYDPQLRKISNIAIVTEGVLGEKIVEISADPRIYREDLSQPLLGEDPLEVRDLAQTFNDTAQALFHTSVQIGVMVEHLEEVSVSIQRLLNRIEQRVIDGNLFKVF